MIQDILVLVIISATVIYAAYKTVNSLRSKKSSPCDGCNGCDLKGLIDNKNGDSYQGHYKNQCDSVKKVSG